MSETAPRISVLMPVFESEQYVALACESVLHQTFTDFELVILDDGSKDGTWPIIEELSRRDNRIVLIKRENRGLITTRNELVAVARASLIAWMDSDDMSRPQRLQHQFNRFSSAPDLICLGGAVLEIDPEGSPLGITCFPESHELILEGMRQGGAMRFPATMMRTQAVRHLGGFRAPFLMGEDFDLFLRLSEVGRLENLSEILLDYRQHLSNTSRKLSDHWPAYRDAILSLADERKSGEDILQRGLPLEIQFPATSSLPLMIEWRSRLDWGRQALHFGYMRTAWKHAFNALFMRPLSTGSWKLLIRVLFTLRGSK